MPPIRKPNSFDLNFIVITPHVIAASSTQARIENNEHNHPFRIKPEGWKFFPFLKAPIDPQSEV